MAEEVRQLQSALLYWHINYITIFLARDLRKMYFTIIVIYITKNLTVGIR